MLETKIQELRKEKPILLMTHLVLGYPSFEANRQTIAAFANAGVELVELQFPFSEPSADGPAIVKANAESLANDTHIETCYQFAAEVTAAYPEINFLLMTYVNILFAQGMEFSLQKAKQAGLVGFIIPDLPPEESEEWAALCKAEDMANVLIMTPTSTPERLTMIGHKSTGLVYSVGRKGVTGLKTNFGEPLSAQIAAYRKATTLPLALGFGVKSAQDVAFLVGKVDIAVIGSKLIEVQLQEGAAGVQAFLNQVR